MSTPLTAEQYSELVVALEEMRARSCGILTLWQSGACSDWCLIYLVQWLHKIGPIESNEHFRYVCRRMVGELCKERCR